MLARASIAMYTMRMKNASIKYFMSLRKSTDDNKHQVLSLPAQQSELDAIAKREGLYVCETIEESQSAKAPGKNRICGWSALEKTGSGRSCPFPRFAMLRNNHERAIWICSGGVVVKRRDDPER